MLDTAITWEKVAVTHTDNSAIPDYTFNLTFTYQQESGQWVGICAELGTSAFAETLEQMQYELRDAVELQLNEMERIADMREYLADNFVVIQPIKPLSQVGFAIV